MMCPHCEATVKKAVEAIEGITAAVASHEQGTVEITYKKKPDLGKIQSVIEEKGYKYIGVK